jgi:hypothetical protein
MAVRTCLAALDSLPTCLSARPPARLHVRLHARSLACLPACPPAWQCPVLPMAPACLLACPPAARLPACPRASDIVIYVTAGRHQRRNESGDIMPARVHA